MGNRENSNASVVHERSLPASVSVAKKGWREALPIALASAALFISLRWPDGLFGLTGRGAAALGVLFLTMTLWVTEVLPLSVTSLIAIALLVVTGVEGSLSSAARGFASDTVFFLLAANLFTHAIADAGLLKRLSRGTVGMARENPRRAVWVVSGMTVFTALLMPSALIRVRALLPVIREIDKLLHIEGRPSRFLKGTGLILGLLAPAASISIVTGGGMSILAAQIIARLYGPLSWIQWFLMMVPPTLVVSLIMTAYIEVVFPPEPARTPAQPLLKGRTGRQVRAGRRREAVAGVVLGLTLLAWLFGSRWNIDFAIPVILAVAVLALPPLRLVTARTIRQQQWDEILVVGSALSLSAALIDGGSVDWVGRKLFGLLPDTLGPAALYSFVVIFSLIFRQLFLQPSPCIAITLPLVIELGRRTGTDPLLLAMLSAGVIGIVQILPIQSPPSLLLYTEGIYEVRDQLRVSPVLVLVTAGVMLLTAFFYWPLLRRIGWVG